MKNIPAHYFNNFSEEMLNYEEYLQGEIFSILNYCEVNKIPSELVRFVFELGVRRYIELGKEINRLPTLFPLVDHK